MADEYDGFDDEALKQKVGSRICLCMAGKRALFVNALYNFILQLCIGAFASSSSFCSTHYSHFKRPVAYNLAWYFLTIVWVGSTRQWLA